MQRQDVGDVLADRPDTRLALQFVNGRPNIGVRAGLKQRPMRCDCCAARYQWCLTERQFALAPQFHDEIRPANVDGQHVGQVLTHAGHTSVVLTAPDLFGHF